MKTRNGWNWMAICTLLVFCGCNKDPNLKFKITAEVPSLETVGIVEEREPVKWQKGDKMILFFNKNVEDDQQVIFVFDGKKWQPHVRNLEYVNSLPGKGILDAIYYEGNDIAMEVDRDGLSSVTSECRGKIRLQAENVKYRCGNGTLKARFEMAYPEDFVQVTLRGVDAFEGWSFYVEPTGSFHHVSAAALGETHISSRPSFLLDKDRPLVLYEHVEGASSCLEYRPSAESEGTKYVFHFMKEGAERTVTFSEPIVPPCGIILE